MSELSDAPPDNANDPVLNSTFALDQLLTLAENLESLAFAISMKVAFEYLPEEALIKLHKALREGSFANPEHRVSEDEDFVARYDAETRSIEVARWAIEAALQQQGTGTLLAAMIEAFARYVEHVVRQDFSDSLPDYAEPTGYRAAVGFFDDNVADGAHFGHYISLESEGELILLLGDGSEYFPVEEIGEPLPENGKFSAGRGGETPHSFAHESIEDVLADLGFSDDERKAIYFGNWLRDYSQLLDPKLVRANDAPKNFPASLSRQALTQIVDMLALKEFVILQTTPEERATYTVTAEMVGVYRPSEHIDNPVSDEDTPDPRSIDSDFEALVLRGDPCLEVDAERSMYRYIDNAIDYMQQKLADAVKAGRTPAGMRFFGEALHVLEDFFAHSNFVELSLRKVVDAKVLPWITERDCKHRWPLVTGRFSGSDIVASVAEPVGNILFPTDSLAFKPTRAGDRSDKEKMLLILLEEHENPQWKATLESFLRARDSLVENPLYPILKHTSWLISMPLQAINQITKLTMQSLLKWAGDNVDDYQLFFGNDPNIDREMFPSHSQLAKDHDTHPFHELAALLARHAVAAVGHAMLDRWSGGWEDDPIAVAKGFFCHANDSQWQDEWVTQWAQQHPDEVAIGCSSNSLDELRKKGLEQAHERLRTLGENDNYAPTAFRESFSGIAPFG